MKFHFEFITLKLYHINLFSYIIFVMQFLKLFFWIYKIDYLFKISYVTGEMNVLFL
jgi:hypothetical protein